MNNVLAEIRNTPEGTNSRVTEYGRRKDKWAGRWNGEINEAVWKKKKEWKEIRTSSEISGTMLNAPTFKSKVPRRRRQKEREWKNISGDNSKKTVIKMWEEIATQVQEA